MRVGIAQIRSTAGDFPGNARRLLQAYRECLDLDADWIVSGLWSLSGGPVKRRDAGSCLQALDYLSGEIRGTPFLVGHCDEEGRAVVSILENGEIRATLATSGVIEWRGRKIGIILDAQRPDEPADLLLYPLAEPFIDAGALRQRRRGVIPDPAEELRPQAAEVQVPSIHCHSLCYSNGAIHPGGAVFRLACDREVHLLREFEEGCWVVNMDAADEAASIRALEGLAHLRCALSFGLSEAVRTGGYLGVTVLDDGSTGAGILRKLASESFEGERFQILEVSEWDLSKGAAAFGEILDPHEAGLDDGDLRALLAAAVANRRGHLLLSGICRTQVLAGEFPLVEALAPLGDLSATRIHELGECLGCDGSAPVSPEREAILHGLAEEELGIDELIAAGYPEHEVLRCQRLIGRGRAASGRSPQVLKLS